uniref:Uncharacterized protein n=1 Tax=Siphoviridae sp. ct3R83 TaxID=2827559 RepID=A0A8S5LPE8_9CAUD|nr:MAG TPA: hypothetical protein [Siphoviridae sp. ct3R83]DAN88527.1 MAG TPA: hypothetical protein [Caudoviricetes sp.]DAR81799.1 MAG TPA: hypothetical protein [Caudoviricetes sp.]DAS47785.1 MAG TPA: hypothetical protein [Caudoviricetes sp.]DAY24593.1 MAG TPA: hypothetical protein [Caudoviricetes sp.]
MKVFLFLFFCSHLKPLRESNPLAYNLSGI